MSYILCEKIMLWKRSMILDLQVIANNFCFFREILLKRKDQHV